MYETKKQTSPLVIVIILANILALVSFFLPFASVFSRSSSMTAFEIIERAIDRSRMPEMLLLFAAVLNIVGLIFSAVAVKNSKGALGAIITSALGMILVYLMGAEDQGFGITLSNFADVGFYLYFAANIAVIVCGIMCVSAASKLVVVPTPRMGGPGPFCPRCGQAQGRVTAICLFCGAPIHTDKTEPPKPEPMPNPAPEMPPEPAKPVSIFVPKPTPEPVPMPSPKPSHAPAAQTKQDKVQCPHCGARQAVGTAKCKYCGTPIQAEPTGQHLPETPVSVSSVNKAERKAVCPHCGARQVTGTANCKYCGTPMK